jgi:hypothetical protein
MRSRFVVLLVVLIMSAIPARSQTLDDQERCASQARKAFQERESDSKKGPFGNLSETISSDYESHYNTKIKKCLMLIENTEWSKTSTNTLVSATLMDAYERHVYAAFSWASREGKKYWEVPPSICDLMPVQQEKKNCASREEFDAFVAGYLEK